ncbi:MAG: Rv1535 domain-containing protein [Mycobacterium sp.]|uniref:Rv1535 domain-containing protein n=1 Tax=Mycobacterium sp. TaxID=1785 RepID=UPI00283F5C40|nr:Rv1535 domain-containing protein [Mycobacterium sp.]HKI40054.1 Rv1535 domain-containing protein [Mycobacterium sp.]
MSTSDSVADPLASSIASVLKVPLVELYALLWRVGVVDIRHSDRTRPRSGRRQPQVVAACPNCPNLPKHGSERLSRRSPLLRCPEPVSTPGDLAVCSQATG